jgi:hypothetical protein
MPTVRVWNGNGGKLSIVASEAIGSNSNSTTKILMMTMMLRPCSRYIDRGTVCCERGELQTNVRVFIEWKTQTRAIKQVEVGNNDATMTLRCWE